MQTMKLIIVCLFIAVALAAKKRGRRPLKRSDVPKRIFTLTAESLLNIQLVRATSVEIGFSYIQGAEGFQVSAKEWIDGSFEQTIATDQQYVDVQQRSAILRNLIPGREYLIQVQATGKNRKPFGTIADKIVRTSQMCYICNGVSENDECNTERDQVECPHDKDACSNTVRFDNNKMTIAKRCAQYNPALTKACNGRENMKDSVCRCMCRSNLCNKLMLPCIDECMDELPMPLRSSLRCSNGRKLGSVCKWECDIGYTLKGLGTSQCRTDRTWSVMSPPQCVYNTNSPPPTGPRRQQCRPIPRSDLVEMSCTLGSKIRSICTFKCKSGFSQDGGSSSRTCGKNLKWTGTPIVCKEINCPMVLKSPGIVKCSNNTKIGSVCDVVTPSTMTCESTGAWKSSHTCSQIAHTPAMCPPLYPPKYGDLQCTNKNEEDSVCEFACASGYTTVGNTATRECKNGKWTGPEITCEQKMCSPLKDESFVKEVVKCSNDHKIGSVCDVITPSVVACKSDGTWSLPLTQEKGCKACKCP